MTVAEMAVSEVSVGSVLHLERHGEQSWLARTFQHNHRRAIFGGCFLGQAIAAARLQTPDRVPTAMFGRFLRPGDPDQPIVYRIECVRDGRSFSERRVWGYQDETAIFDALISLQVETEGVTHQKRAPDVRGPHESPAISDLAALYPDHVTDDLVDQLTQMSSIETRFYEPLDYLARLGPPAGKFWVRGRGTSPTTDSYALLAYLSDYMMPGACMLPHVSSIYDPSITSVSLNHAMWFHSASDPAAWCLHDTHSPWAGSGRGLSHGHMFDAGGSLLASTSQELLLRSNS